MIKLSNFQKLLGAFILFISGMIICRIIYSGNIRFVFLLWNLFLAWIPFKVSRYLSAEKVTNKWLAGLLFAGWLLFFPNALYIVTDLVHLESKSNVPVWYDAVLLFTSAIAGLLMAFASLYKVETFLTRRISSSAAGKVVVVCLFVGSFGVYLGRFLRWNSWDVITSPFSLASEIGIRLIFPFDYYSTWAITLLFTSLFSLLYFAVKNVIIYGAPLNNSVGPGK